MAPKRGVKQRLGIDNEPRTPKQTRLGHEYKDLVRAGRLSAVKVASVAGALPACALNEGTDASRFAAASTRSSKNASRSITRTLDANCKLPPLYMATTVFWDSTTMSKQDGDLAFMPPHELLGALVVPGSEERWTSFDSSQKGFEVELRSLYERVGGADASK